MHLRVHGDALGSTVFMGERGGGRKFQVARQRLKLFPHPNGHIVTLDAHGDTSANFGFWGEG